MSRRLRLWLIVAGSVVVLGGAFLWVLPEIVRRTVLAEIPKLTGRAASIQDIDLNLFTGRLAIKKLRLAEREPAETFIQAERIDLRVSPLSLVVGHLRLADLTLTAPVIRIVRTGPVEFNFSDLLARLPPAEPNKPKSRWTVSIDRLALINGAVLVSDRAVSPARYWQIQGITVAAGGLTTRAAQQPGHLDVRARVNEAPLDANAGSIVLTPAALTMRLSLDRFDLTQVRPYLPPDLPASLESGTLGLALEVVVARGTDRLTSALVSGDIRVEGLALAQPGRPARFVTLPKLTVAIKEADLLSRSVTLKSVEADGLDLRAARDKAGNIDLLALAGGSTGAAAPPDVGAPAAGPPSGSVPQSPSSAAPPFKMKLERLTLRSGTVTVNDQAVSPEREWRLQGLAAEGAGLSTSSEDPPGTLKIQARLSSAPGTRKLATISVDAGSLRLIPLSATARLVLDGFDLGLLGPYWPPALPAIVREGSLGITVNAGVERGEAGLSRAVASGSVRLDALTLIRRGQTAPFLTVPRLTVGVKQADMIARTVALGQVAVEGLDARAVRDAAGKIDLLELISAAPAGTGASVTPAAPVVALPASGPRPWRINLDRFDFTKGTATLEDRAVSPATTLALTDLSVTAEHVTWPSTTRATSAAEAAPGTLEIRGLLNSTPGPQRPATLSVDVGSLRLSPLSATARLGLAGFDLAVLGPYWPTSLPVIARTGSLGLTADVGVERGEAGLSRGVASGTVRLEALNLARRDQPAPFLAVPRLTVGVKQADIIGQTVALGDVTVDGLEARAVRDSAGKIDLLDLVAAAPASARPPTGVAPPAKRPSKAPASGPPPWRISLDRFALTKGRARFEDQAVSPATALALTDLAVTAEHATWPSTTPATFSVSVTMPGGGRTEVKGRGKLEPLDVQITMSTRDAPIEPYQSYFPFPARFVGFFSGDSLSEIQRAKDGKLILASRGHAWARDLEVRAPDGGAPVARMARMDIQGIDFSWPNYALVDRVTLTQPQAQIERDSGGINLRRLFEPGGAQAPKPAPGPPSPAPRPAGKPGDGKPAAGEPARSGGLLQELVLDFNEIAIEDGYFRFLDRTTTPPFSEDMSGFALTIRGLSNQMGRRRTNLTAKATVGGDSTLTMQGELSGIGEGLRADLTGELRDFGLPVANPYAESFTSWIIDRGKLLAQFHYQVEGDRLVAAHDLKFAGLQVERARQTDQARQRIGLPLGLVVAMLKDRHGDINLSIPLRGTLSDRTFDWREAMLASARQVVVKLVVSPFSAIGRAFTSGDDKVEKLEVDPVTFAAASSVIAPPMETHVTRVADFLRRAPYIKFKLTPAVSPADVETLKTQAIDARLQQLQRQQGLRDQADTLRAYYMQNVRDVTLPKTVDEQLALLKKREPVPEGPLADLLKRRIDATRDRLVKAEGIPAERLTTAIPPAAAAAASAAGDGRVEFSIDTAEQ